MRNHSFLLRWLPLVYCSYILSSFWLYMLSRSLLTVCLLLLGTSSVLYQPFPQLPVGKFACLYHDCGLLVSSVKTFTTQASITLMTLSFLWILTIPSLNSCLPVILVFTGIPPLNFVVVLVNFAFGPPVEHSSLVVYLDLHSIFPPASPLPSASLFFQLYSLGTSFSLDF